MKKMTMCIVLCILLSFMLYNCENSMPNAVQDSQPEQITSLAKGGAYSDYGYNYNAHMFRGSYFNAYAKSAGYPPYDGDDLAYLAANPNAEDHWAWPYRGVNLIMKWNEAWLSKTGERPDNYIGSGAWLTNHQSGEDADGHWTYFTKIVAAPADAVKSDGMWYTADGQLIGPVIWGAFATIQKVSSGSGATFVSPAGPGLGKW